MMIANLFTQLFLEVYQDWGKVGNKKIARRERLKLKNELRLLMLEVEEASLRLLCQDGRDWLAYQKRVKGILYGRRGKRPLLKGEEVVYIYAIEQTKKPLNDSGKVVDDIPSKGDEL